MQANVFMAKMINQKQHEYKWPPTIMLKKKSADQHKATLQLS